MKYKVESKLRVGNDTSISVSPIPPNLKNGVIFLDELSRQYEVIGVGMIRPIDGAPIKDEVEILVKWFFSGNFVEMIN